MLDVALLGTGGMAPLPGRPLTSLMVRYNGGSYMIDCGEGTQVAVKEAGLGFKQLKALLFTHFHADHIAGLPGLLLTVGNAGKSEPLIIAGPPGIERVCRSLCVIAPQLPFPLVFHEIVGNGPLLRFEDLSISTLAVPHNLPCYAYSMELARTGKFNAVKAKELDIPVQLWSLLQKGIPAELPGRTILPQEVLGPPRKGLKLCYATDMRPTEELVAFAAGSDLFVCEGQYGDPEKMEKAKEYMHCMISEAAEMAKNAKAKELWLTHFSPSMSNPLEWLPLAREIFPNTYMEQRKTVLSFE